jgi:outer membrane protein assembly factor BamB
MSHFSTRFLSLVSLLVLLFCTNSLLTGCQALNTLINRMDESIGKTSRLDAASGRGVKPTSLLALRSVLWMRGRVKVHAKDAINPLVWKLGAQEGAAPLVMDKTTLYIGSSEQKFTRYDISQSLRLKRKWEKKVQGRILSSAVANDDAVFFGTTRGVFYAMEVETGKTLWTYRVGGEILSKPVLVDNEDNKRPSMVLFSTSNNKVYALNIEKGQLLWQYKRDPAASLTIRGQAPPVVHNNRVYTGFSDGVVVSLNLFSGEEIWAKNLSERTRFVDVDMAPVIGDKVLYVSSYSGSLHALSLKNGARKWKRRIVGASKVYLQSDQYDKALYVTSVDNEILRLNPFTGQVIWKKKFRRSGGFGTPVGNRRYLIVASKQYGLYVLKKSNGQLIQVLRTGGLFHAPLVLDDTLLYALSSGRFLYTFSTERGRIQRENR